MPWPAGLLPADFHSLWAKPADSLRPLARLLSSDERSAGKLPCAAFGAVRRDARLRSLRGFFFRLR